MNIEKNQELKEAKQLAEKQIAEIIGRFEDEQGLKVESVLHSSRAETEVISEPIYMELSTGKTLHYCKILIK